MFIVSVCCRLCVFNKYLINSVRFRERVVDLVVASSLQTGFVVIVNRLGIALPDGYGQYVVDGRRHVSESSMRLPDNRLAGKYNFLLSISLCLSYTLKCTPS